MTHTKTQMALSLREKKLEAGTRSKQNDASFVDPSDGLMFSLKRVDGARMFRGRELVAGCLAWSGLAYVLPPETKEFAYSIELGRI